MDLDKKRIATIYDLSRFYQKHCFDCFDCPLSRIHNGCDIGCADIIKKYPDKANEIILNWCDEHPQKTYKEDFLEKFPEAEKDIDGSLNVCRLEVYGYKNVNCPYDCVTCWNTEISE